MLVKCFWCKEKDEKVNMLCEEKSTGKFNKNGTEKMIRKYFHYGCNEEYQKDKKFKEEESKQFTELYEYLLKLHGLKVLDGRMIEKIQDLRNGTVKVKNKKIKKYKSGITYELMLQTYQYLNQRIDIILRSSQLQPKWNEFSYIFGTMINNVNEVSQMNKRKEQVRVPNKAVNHDVGINVSKKEVKKKDELDISEFL